MTWIEAGYGFELRFTPSVIQWIWMKPGNPTLDGEISWKEFNIEYKNDSEQILNDLISAGILELLKDKVRKRLEKREPLNIPHESKAYLLGQFVNPSLQLFPKTIVNFFRHHCSPYNKRLENGEDRGIVTLQVHNILLEIIEYFEENKELILKRHEDKPTSETKWQKALAEMDHKNIVSEILAQNREKSNID